MIDGLVIFVIGVAVIVAAFFFSFRISECLAEEKKFNGVALGIWSAFFSGFVLVLLAYYLGFSKQIESMENKKYKKYAQQEIRKFMNCYIPLRIAVVVFPWVFIIGSGLVIGATTN